MSNFIIGLVIFLHIGFLAVEMFFWTTPMVRENFGLTLEQATIMAPLAANQGLSNGFLASGLFWGWLAKQEGYSSKVFFLICIIIAGMYGAATVKLSILFVQALPAAIALLLVWLEHREYERSIDAIASHR